MDSNEQVLPSGLMGLPSHPVGQVTEEQTQYVICQGELSDTGWSGRLGDTGSVGGGSTPHRAVRQE